MTIAGKSSSANTTHHTLKIAFLIFFFIFSYFCGLYVKKKLYFCSGVYARPEKQSSVQAELRGGYKRLSNCGHCFA